jgi:hypothetical protein
MLHGSRGGMAGVLCYNRARIAQTWIIHVNKSKVCGGDCKSTARPRGDGNSGSGRKVQQPVKFEFRGKS